MPLEQLAFPGINLEPHFDGATYEPARDQKRLVSQLDLVRDLLLSGGWWTISQLIDAIWKRGIGATQQGVSARIRDLRKPRFGGYTIERRRALDGSPGLYEYRVMKEAA